MNIVYLLKRTLLIVTFFCIAFLENAMCTLTPVARFDAVPYQRISAGEQINVGVVAFSMAGIERVEFTISGQGYKGENPLVVNNMTYNPQTDVFEYWVPVKANDFTSDGVIEIEAVAIGKDGGVKDKDWLINDSLGTKFSFVNYYTETDGYFEYFTDITGIESFNDSLLYSDVLLYKKDKGWWNGLKISLNDIDGNKITVKYGESYGSSPKDLDYKPIDGDGFVLSRGFGLDPLVLVVNPNGTIPEPSAYVDLNGDDDSGEVNNPDKPFATTGGAMFGIRDWMDANGYGQYINGGKVILNPGTHTHSNGGKYGKIESVDEWVTFTSNPDIGGNQTNTTITGSQQIPTELIKVIGLLIESTDADQDVFRVGSDLKPKFKLWIDNCSLKGATKFYHVSNPVSSKFLWYTNSYFTNMGKAVDGAQLARNLTIEHIGDDAFVRTPFVINCKADDIDPRDGTCEGGDCAHADCWQWWGRPVPNNMIIYGLDCLNCTYQGLFARTQDGNVPEGFQNPVTQGVAIVNLHTRLIDPSNFADNSWSISANHMMLWHNTFNQDVNFWNDSDQSSDYPLNITNFDVRGNCFYNVELKTKLGDDNGGDPDAPGIELSSWNNNHYEKEAGSEPWVETPGDNFTTGDPTLDSNGVPLAGSPLLDRFSDQLVPVDAHNNQRDSKADVGAIEYSEASFVNSVVAESTILVYPNPAKRKIYVTSLKNEDNPVKIKLFNRLGHLVYESPQFSGENSIAIPVNTFTPGYYLIQVVNRSGFTENKQLIILKEN